MVSQAARPTGRRDPEGLVAVVHAPAALLANRLVTGRAVGEQRAFRRSDRVMSGSGTFETWREHPGTSAMGGIADMRQCARKSESDPTRTLPRGSTKERI
jgi:hypothetical protein